jgi:copper transport protein
MRVLAALAVVLAILTGGEAAAHAVLLETAPADRAVLSASPAAIVLTFSEAIEPVAVRLIDGAGAAVASAVSAAGATLRVTPAAPLARGVYIVSWRVISADAHPVAGAFQFAVGAAPSTWAASSQTAPATDWTIIAAANRAAHLIALLIAVGGVLYAFAVAAHPRRAMLWAALVAAVTAFLGVGIEGALVLDLPMAGLFDLETWRYGATTTRGVAAAVAVIGLAGIALGAGVLGAVVALASFALSGHAATAPPQAVALPALLLHAAIATFWVGSFLPLRRAARGEVARFSSIAIWLVPLLLAAGLVMALLQVPRLDALVTTGYGIALLVKVTLVGALLLVAGFNRFVLMPRLPDSMRRLRASIAVELALAVAILGATAALSQLTPPRSTAAPGAASRSFSVAAEKPSAIVVSGNLVATIEATPGRPGSNIVAVDFADRAGRKVTPQEVTLYLSNAAAGIEELERRMARYADGLWRQGGPELAVAGTWTIRVDALVTDFDKVVFTTSLTIR